MNLTYRQEGDYLYPNLTEPTPNPTPMGRYGLLRKAYLKEHRPGHYNHLLMSGQLAEHLHQIDEAARQMTEQTMERLMRSENLPSRNQNPLEWVGAMNNLRHSAEELVMHDLIYSN